METIAGGILKIDFDDDDLFLNPTEIPGVLKEGTSLLPYTEGEEEADGHEVGTLKEMDVSIRSADNTTGVGSAYERLKNAEESRAGLAFRFWLLGGKVLILRNVVQRTKREINEPGKFNALNIYGVGVADTENALWSLLTIIIEEPVIYAGSNNAVSIGPGSTVFLTPFGSAQQNSASEKWAVIQVEVPGTFLKLYCRITRATANNSSKYTFTWKKGATIGAMADQTLTKQIGPANNGDAVGSDLVNSFHANAGDLVCVKVVGDGSGGSVDVASFSTHFVPDP